MTLPKRLLGSSALLFAALSFAWLSPACRSLMICGDGCVPAAGAGGESDEQDASAGDGSSGGSPSPSAGGTSGAGAESGASAGLDASAGAGGQAGAPAENEGGAKSCAYPQGECDGTLQTVCESDLDWNARNCGACSRTCDGACAQSECSLEEPVFEGGEALAVLADERGYYFLTFHGQLVRVDPVWAEPQVLTSNLDLSESLDSLARTEDSIYVWGGIWPIPQRVALDSGEVVSEAFTASSFGASRAGIYYEDEQGLWFRAKVGGKATLLSTQASNILCSSASFVLIETNWPDSSLYFARGTKLTRIGATPDYVQRALCSTDAALLLNDEQAVRVSEAGVEPPATIAQRRYLAQQSLPVFDGTSFSLSYEHRGHANVRTFLLGSPGDTSIVGLPNSARLVHRDANYVWYNAPDPPRLSAQLKRARLP